MRDHTATDLPCPHAPLTEAPRRRRQLTAVIVALIAATLGAVVADSGPAGANGSDTMPTISAIAPTSGPTTGGTTVLITGTGFIDGGVPGDVGVDDDEPSAVTFGGVNATSFSVDSDTEITAVSPAHATGAITVTVTSGAGALGNASSPGPGSVFTYGDPPVVMSLAPDSGEVAGGTTVVITGSGFLAGVSAPSDVQFGSTNATSYTVDSDNQITAESPAHSAGTVDVIVTNSTGPSSTGPGSEFTFMAGTTTTTSTTTTTTTTTTTSSTTTSTTVPVVVPPTTVPAPTTTDAPPPATVAAKTSNPTPAPGETVPISAPAQGGTAVLDPTRPAAAVFIPANGGPDIALPAPVITVNANGSVSVSITVPPGTPAGVYLIAVVGTDARGVSRAIIVPVVVRTRPRTAVALPPMGQSPVAGPMAAVWDRLSQPVNSPEQVALATALALAALGFAVRPRWTSLLSTSRSRRRLLALAAGGAVVLGACSAASARPDVTANRLAGADRYATASAVARSAFTAPSTVAILTGGEAFADALPAAYLSGAEGAPLFLTSRDVVPPSVLEALDALQVDGIQIIGGTSVVSDLVVTALEAEGYAVERLAGADRYETARKVAELLPLEAVGRFGAGRAAIVVSGTAFPDALVAGPISASQGMPILLTTPEALSAHTTAALQNLDIDQVIIIGGTGAVSAAVETQLQSMELTTRRVAGASRQATAVKVAEMAEAELAYPLSKVLLAGGSSFADGLAGGPAGGRSFAPLLLTDGTSLGTDTRDYLIAHAATIRTVDVLGGTAVVSEAVVADALAAAGR